MTGKERIFKFVMQLKEDIDSFVLGDKEEEMRELRKIEENWERMEIGEEK